jgi:DNA replication and repair protein RecF
MKGLDGFRLEGHFMLNNATELCHCKVQENSKKEMAINGVLYEKLSKHIGHYPCVVIAPDDIELITGDSKSRRDFLDQLLSQIDQTYLQHLITHNKLLQQRNALLKQLFESNSKGNELLDILDKQIAIPAKYIIEERIALLKTFIPSIQRIYKNIAGENMNLQEEIQISYTQSINESDIEKTLKNNRVRDIYAQRTTEGIHKDDIEFKMNEQAFKSTASQGQRKSLLFAIKLAEIEIIKNHKQFSPILLLDDIFEKLDESRIENLLRTVCKENNGQVFITDTNEERLSQHLASIGVAYQLIAL